MAGWPKKARDVAAGQLLEGPLGHVGHQRAQQSVETERKVAPVGVDYHVEVGGHYYSVPCQHAPAQVDVRVKRTTVEVFQRSQRIASHVQCAFRGPA